MLRTKASLKLPIRMTTPVVSAVPAPLDWLLPVQEALATRLILTMRRTRPASASTLLFLKGLPVMLNPWQARLG